MLGQILQHARVTLARVDSDISVEQPRQPHQSQRVFRVSVRGTGTCFNLGICLSISTASLMLPRAGKIKVTSPLRLISSSALFSYAISAGIRTAWLLPDLKARVRAMCASKPQYNMEDHNVNTCIYTA